MFPLSLRLRSFLSDYFAVLVVAFLLAGLFGGYVAFDAHTATETETRTETVGTWTADTDFHHAAVVQRDTHVFAAGERLENRTRYFTRIAPLVEGAYVVTHRGTDREPADVSVDLELVLRAVEIDSADGEPNEQVHWQVRRDLGSAETEALADEEEFRVEFETNVTALADRIAEIESDLGASPGTTEILIVAETTIEGGTSDESVTESRHDRLELVPDGGTYSVDADFADPTSHEVTRTTTVEVSPSPLRAYGSILLLFGGLAAAGGLVYAREQGAFEVTPGEAARHEFVTAQEDYDRWISPGEMPATDDRDTVYMNSLESVVDVAIDSNRRVIEVSDEERYVVLVDDVAYVYEPEFV